MNDYEPLDLSAFYNAGPEVYGAGRKPATGDMATLDAQRLQPGLAEIGLQDEAIVARADDDAVILGHGHSMPSSR